jgi:hypothetical protein
MSRKSWTTPAFSAKGDGDLFRVWADGTTQMVEDGAPYTWMSDDYALVLAASEEDASTSWVSLGWGKVA